MCMSKATGKDPKAIEKAIDRDTWMSGAGSALEFGLLDSVVSSYKDLVLIDFMAASFSKYQEARAMTSSSSISP